MIEKIENALVFIIQRLMAVIFITAAVLYALQITLRIGFSSGLLWIDALSSRMFALSALLGAALAARDGENIKIQVFKNLAQKKIFRLLLACFSLSISLFLLFIFFLYLQETAPSLFQSRGHAGISFVFIVEIASYILYFIFFLFLMSFYILRLAALLQKIQSSKE